jgi:hypothetical protein
MFAEHVSRTTETLIAQSPPVRKHRPPLAPRSSETQQGNVFCTFSSSSPCYSESRIGTDGNMSRVGEDEDAAAAEEGGEEEGGEWEGEEQGEAHGGGVGGTRGEETKEGVKKTQTRKPLRLGHGRNNFRIDFA